MPQTPKITRASWAMVAALGLIWGATFMAIEVALRGISPLWLASFRLLFAGLLLGGVWAFRGFATGFSDDGRRRGPTIILVGILSSALPFALLSWGQQYVTSGFAGVSMAAVALMVLPLAHFLVPGERLSWRKSLGFGVGFAGVLVLIGSQAFASSGAPLETYGRLACLGAAACYAVSSILVRRCPPIDPVALATLLIWVGTVALVPVAWAVEGPPPLPAPDILLVLAALGLVPTAGANLLRVLVIRSAGPTFMSLTNYQVPVWSVLLGALVLKEPLTPSLLGALGLILCGVAISQWQALRRLFRRG